MINKVIKRGSDWASGPEINDFENNLGQYLNKRYVVTFNSGTSALHSVLLAHGLTSGEIIVPSFSFISTANCVILAGSKPVFSEIEEKTLGLDIEFLKEKINPKTKAIIPVHYGGKVCKDIKAIKEIAEDNNLYLIEDTAESFGAKMNNKLAGTFGESGMFSFCQNKIITTGEGGAICTDDEKIYQKLKLIRSHGRVEKKGEDYFSNINEMEYIEIGYNYRMPTINAAIGISQLSKIDKIMKIRIEKGKFYDDKLKNIKQFQIIPELKESITVYQLYSIFLKYPEDRLEIQNYLLENGIYTKVYFYPIHLKSYYKEQFGYQGGDLPITEKISKKILTLPMSLGFTQADQNFIIDKLEKFYS
ncbi:MAG: DegT/DnrJ/EryC1/StrS family aminotransferase [Patescibacteria group bacterium]|nr:DegT/DnrJ/EryC1/StrS family aminotransferase [Patescibacteria group bacterium]